MENLTQRLRAEHQTLLEIVGTLDRHLKAADLQNVNQALSELKAAMLAHLTVEDAELYPGLITLADRVGDEAMAKTARAFQDNMSRISAGLVTFLNRYEGKRFDIVAFTTDWRSIVEVLSARIGSEEKVLYPMFDKARAKVAPKPK